MVRENDTEGVMKLIAAGGFKDITRIGSSSPVMWENICINNKDAILDYLSKYRELIDKAYSYVAENDRKAIYNIFETSKEYRDSISNSSAKTITSFYEIYVDVSDTKGIIARIAKILADNDINLKNIGIVNNREFENGALRVEFKEEKEYNKAIDTLKKEGFKVY
jgi:prephenate dehydrogenase